MKHKDLTPTGSMVLSLVKRLPKLHEQPYIVYLDNYFTSIPLFRLMRDINIGACGTTRSTSSKDFPVLLKELKEDHAKSIPWNTICAILSDDKKVLCLAWQDNNIVLCLSTVHTVHNATDFIERDRRRPSKTSTNAAITRKVFGDDVRKRLKIPNFIDDYNYHMGGVDIANQYRASYETHKPVFRSWFCIFTALLDIVIVNCFRISYITAVQRGVPPTRLPTQAMFRERLFKRLFSFASDPSLSRRSTIERPLSIAHEWEDRATKIECFQCRLEIRTAKKLQARGARVARMPHMDKAGRATRTSRGCKRCKVALCVRNGCWERFHSKLSE